MEPQTASAGAARAAIETVFRLESPRVIAGVARVVRDIGIAEELAQDALVAALERWPRDGVPGNPGAWLMATARHRAVDLVRRRETYARKLAEIGRGLPDAAPPEEPADPDDIDDDLLRLVFTACHPVLSAEARTALTLRLLGGLSTAEIARAFLVPEATVAQRVVRAKRTLATRGVPFEVPRGPDREARLGSVLDVIYLIFNEGYAATAGDDLLRPALCEDALRLARVLSALMPKEPEVHGLTALLEFQSSRTAARTAPDGTPVLLKDQDRRRWNRLLITRGLTALARTDPAAPGPYVLQAAIAACHAQAFTYEETDWPRIAALYGRLAARAPSPVVELNRAVAVSMAEGPGPALEIVDALAAGPALRGYHLLPSVRGDLLHRLGRTAEARAEFERAASLAGNARERDLLVRRARECG
ncbi:MULTISPECIES: RNA polymerase sigma factor [Streptomyces]|uniref:RNA polymerase sigma factor (Sigma-70 family) n=2 Tax=Streptomyces TaxID=1883 RepID=A0ABT9LK24_STRGD|nr:MULTISPECIES: RNA polymerase sigma factor [Streptomyces]MDP9683585.1 RNA polymerase sigma factor (sigma-70 family) [Streptomyces griseoviridis]GGS93850.1 RNA polymerase subunit sigma-24 [Streptomyces griseoviridis]GGU21506.1 RNA polymerase subunit sigma-24 [Streptomyces daghestanicus]GHI31472.1 RNA polymerase subunit sigma-24 [Streptomyces daghestanicus]